MADINPAEVSSILREQLAGSASAAQLEEVGTVLQVETELPAFTD